MGGSKPTPEVSTYSYAIRGNRIRKTACEVSGGFPAATRQALCSLLLSRQSMALDRKRNKNRTIESVTEKKPNDGLTRSP